MFTKSENYKQEYCAQVVKIGELYPIENSDFLVRTVVNGFNVVVGKNDVKEGQIMIYVKVEDEINNEFLSVNNQFELSERHLNKNYEEVQALIDEGKNDEAKKLVGYFNKYGRVRIVKLRQVPSEGCLFTIESLVKWKSEIADYDFTQCFIPNEDGIVEPYCFDTIGGDLFVKAYVPRISNREQARADRAAKRNKKLKRFDRMVEGQFSYHYDTQQLTDNMWRLKPETAVFISVKEHGTSLIVGKLLVKKPLPATLPRRMKNKNMYHRLKALAKAQRRYPWQKAAVKNEIARIKDYINSQFKLEYGNVTSSRTVIKNQYINSGIQHHFYGTDVWSKYGELIYPYLIEGMTLYGEICGYVDGSQSMIQKGYDYGCQPGTSYLMPYRITFTDSEGNHTEWELDEVWGWTKALIENHPELADKVKPINILYHGTLGNLYPDINTSEHWNENVLAAMRNDHEHFGMELDEPMCKNKVPREGIVVRIEGDTKSEAWKLKTDSFKFREAKQMDKGEVDIEMKDVYLNNK